MRTYRVTLSPDAENDLASIYRHLLKVSSRTRAEDVLGQLTGACRNLRHFPLRGVKRDDLRPGVRTIGYRRWASIAFVVEADEVVILQVAWRGRDVAAIPDQHR